MEKHLFAYAKGSDLTVGQAPFEAGFARLLRYWKDLGKLAEVSGGGGEEEFIVCTAWSLQSEPSQPEDAFGMGHSISNFF